jgi:hypothetical protein
MGTSQATNIKQSREFGEMVITQQHITKTNGRVMDLWTDTMLLESWPFHIKDLE